MVSVTSAFGQVGQPDSNMLVFVGFHSSKFGLEWVAVGWVALYVSNLCLRVRSNFIGKSRAKAEKQAGTSPPQDLNSSIANQHSKSKLTFSPGSLTLTRRFTPAPSQLAFLLC